MPEEPRRIIIGKKCRRIQTQRCGTFECRFVNQGAGRIIGAVAVVERGQHAAAQGSGIAGCCPSVVGWLG